MSKVHTLPKPKKGEVHSYFLFSDVHDFKMDRPTFDIAIKMAKMVPKSQRRLIIMGDLLDYPEFMKKRNPLYRKHLKSATGIEDYFIPAMDKAVSWGNDFMDEVSKVFPHITYICGNHDWRPIDFMETDCPVEYRPYFDLRERLALRPRGIEFIPYNDFLKIGNVMLTHGMYHGTTAVKKHVESAGMSCIFGHVHQHELRPFDRVGDTVIGCSLPCMSNLNPHYIRNRVNKWTLGFGMLHIDYNSFHLDVKTVWNGKLINDNGMVIYP